jgi:hypothetical protein
MSNANIDTDIDDTLSSQEQNNPKYTFVIPEANEISKTINDKKFNETKDNDYYIRLYNLSRILLDLGLLKNLKKKGFGFIYNTDTELDSFHRELITALTQIASDEDQNNSSNQPQPIDLYQCLKEFLGENSADSADDDIIAKSTVEINKEILITKVKKYIATNVDDNKEALDIKKTGADASQEEDTPIGEDFPIQYSADKIKSEDGSVVKILGLLSNEADDEGDSEFKKYQELDVGEQKTAIRNFYYIYLTKYLFETEANINPFGSEFIKIANELNFNEFGDLGAVKDEINAYIDLIKNVNNSDVFIVDMNKIENDFSNFYKCLQWVKEYFGNNKIFNKTLNLNNNFIKFIQLKLLDEVLADTTNDTLEKQKLRRKTEALLQRFIKNPSITDIETKQSN